MHPHSLPYLKCQNGIGSKLARSDKLDRGGPLAVDRMSQVYTVQTEDGDIGPELVADLQAQLASACAEMAILRAKYEGRVATVNVSPVLMPAKVYLHHRLCCLPGTCHHTASVTMSFTMHMT